MSNWTYTTVGWGQGRFRLGIRVRSAAEADDAGAIIRTPEGGEARVRVFACDQSPAYVRQLVRHRLRTRLLGSEILDYGRVFAWSWRQGEALEGNIVNAAVAHNGPLLISVSSSTLPRDEVIQLARRVRLDLPLPLIPGCLPICELEDAKCVPQLPEDDA